jgi:hypothetical protein
LDEPGDVANKFDRQRGVEEFGNIVADLLQRSQRFQELFTTITIAATVAKGGRQE